LYATEGIAQTSAEFQTTTKSQIKAIEDEKASRTPAEQKISSHLLDAVKQKKVGVVVPNARNLKAPKLPTCDGGVCVDITAKVSDELIHTIESLGGKVVNKFPEYDAIRASMPLENIETLAKDDDVKQIIPAVKAKKMRHLL
jgi:hypothetical protein